MSKPPSKASDEIRRWHWGDHPEHQKKIRKEISRGTLGGSKKDREWEQEDRSCWYILSVKIRADGFRRRGILQNNEKWIKPVRIIDIRGSY